MRALLSTLPSTLRTRYGEDIALLDTTFVRVWAVIGIVLALLLPQFLTNYWAGVFNETLIVIVGALALNLLMGTTGQISLGHAGFVAAGAFTVAILLSWTALPIFIPLAAAAFVGAVLGVLVGLPALRLKGLYLAVSTLAAHFVIVVAFGQYQAFVSYGSGFTIDPPDVFGVALTSERRWSYFLLPVALAVLVVNANWLRSAYGRAWLAIKNKEVAAEALGVNAPKFKLIAFSASTALTCFAGGLWAYHTGFVSIEAFDFNMLVQFLAVVIIGGLGSLLGVVLGSVLVVVLPHLISSAVEATPLLKGSGMQAFEIQNLLFGATMLAFLILEPRGLAGIWARARVYFELWPFKTRSWDS